MMAKTKALPWTILGREIGTATGWDQADTFIMQLYDFMPAAGVDLPSGTISINFETGMVESWDDNGQIIKARDIVTAVCALSCFSQKPPVSREMEKYVEIRPVVMEGSPDAHNVFLKVTNQSFCVTPYGCETKEDAEWSRDMLCVALEKIVADAGAGDNVSEPPTPESGNG
jgi:hypothetical protein